MFSKLIVKQCTESTDEHTWKYVDYKPIPYLNLSLGTHLHGGRAHGEELGERPSREADDEGGALVRSK